GGGIADRLVNNLALTVDNHVAGNGLQGELSEHRAVEIGHDGKRITGFFNKWVQLVPALFARQDQYLEFRIVAVGIPKFRLHPGQFLPARRAPGSKKIEQDDFAPVILDRLRRSALGLESKSGDFLAYLRQPG